MILQTAHLKQSSSFTRWTEELSRFYSDIMDLGVLSCVWSSNGMNGFFNQLSTVCYTFVLSHFSHVWLCHPMDYSSLVSTAHGILQARILEWVAMPSSRGSSRPRERTGISYVSCVVRQAGSLPRTPTRKPLLNIYWLVILSMLFYFHAI